MERVAQPVADEVERQYGEEDRAAGEQRPMRGDVEVVLGIEQNASPGGNVGREAETEKGKGRFENNSGGDIDRRGDDHRPQRIRQDVPHHQTQTAHTQRPSRLDELLFAQRQELRPNQPRRRHPAQAANNRDDQDEGSELGSYQLLQRVTEQVNEQQQQRQRRQRREQ